jgi:hypothetical protein
MRNFAFFRVYPWQFSRVGIKEEQIESDPITYKVD